MKKTTADHRKEIRVKFEKLIDEIVELRHRAVTRGIEPTEVWLDREHYHTIKCEMFFQEREGLVQMVVPPGGYEGPGYRDTNVSDIVILGLRVRPTEHGIRVGISFSNVEDFPIRPERLTIPQVEPNKLLDTFPPAS